MNWHSLELLFWELALCFVSGGLFGHLAVRLAAPQSMLLFGVASVVAVRMYVEWHEDEVQ